MPNIKAIVMTGPGGSAVCAVFSVHSAQLRFTHLCAMSVFNGLESWSSSFVLNDADPFRRGSSLKSSFGNSEMEWIMGDHRCLVCRNLTPR